MAPTDKQSTYIESLKADRIRQLTSAIKRVSPQTVIEAAWAYGLPAPADARDASEQIDGLKTSLRQYAKAHADWGQDIVNRVCAVIGNDGSNCPTAETSIPDFSQPGTPVGRTLVNGMEPADYIASILGS